MLTSGSKLGPYEIQDQLGAGGMGEVYRARDTRLNRIVAIKILAARVAANSDLHQRFEREARAISSLNHPHICGLYDVGQSDGVDFLIMEYVEGETLASRLKRGPIPTPQLLTIAAEIADALDKAHRSGIVHRDLKPGNIMLTKSGAKLLDFGLAKPLATTVGASANSVPVFSAAVTIASPDSPLTSAGMIVGTMHYMSPEQIEGKEADARSDIFAFGAVIYEMATGKRAFDGKSQISVASSILEKDPEPISSIQPLVPPTLEQVVKTCLSKDPDERFQTAHDLMLQLRWIAQPSGVVPRPAVAVSPRKRVLTLAGALLALIAVGVAAFLFGRSAQPQPVLRAIITAPGKFVFDSTGDYGGVPQLSPDGSRIVFLAHTANAPRGLWVRSLDSFSAQRLDGTDNAYDPFWSSDGRSIGFFANGKLLKIAATGGPVAVLADAPNARGGSWGPDNVILFSPDFQSNIFRVGASGGSATPVTRIDTSKHTTHRWPVALPDGKHFLYLATNHNGTGAQENGIYFGSLDGKEDRLLVASDSAGDYSSGYLLYHFGTALMAQRSRNRQAFRRGWSFGGSRTPRCGRLAHRLFHLGERRHDLPARRR